MSTRNALMVVIALALGLLFAAPAPVYGQNPFGLGARLSPEFAPRVVPTSDTFTFCRIRFRSMDNRPMWAVDYPESDLNFSQRLEELTTIKVKRNDQGEIHHVVLDLTSDALFDYPFIYMLEVGLLSFSEEEVVRLRAYLLRGGFLMVDDFWGTREWKNWEYEISRVFPPEEYKMVELGLDHPIFNCVFMLKEKPQIPSLYFWRSTGLTSERYQDSEVPHYKGIFDKEGRLMVVICHNTDLGDGWEREAENEQYFNEFSAKRAYPLGINIVVYAMTH